MEWRRPKASTPASRLGESRFSEREARSQQLNEGKTAPLSRSLRLNNSTSTIIASINRSDKNQTMAEIIGAASGCMTLVGFALKSSITLYEAIQSFKSHSQRVRDLADEVLALHQVLQALAGTAANLKDLDFSSLELPLLRCSDACKDFGQLLEKVSPRASRNRTSFRDWAKLKYMGEDIDYFRRLLASYKMTINVALTDVTL
jgi:hypothetical protein